MGAKRAGFEAEALVHLDLLVALALRFTGGDEAASQDLVQDTMLKAYRAWDSFESGTNCRAWLTTILRNTFINNLRRRQKRPASVAYEEVAERSVFAELTESAAEGGFFNRIIDEEVIRAIEELPADFRVPLVMADLQDMGYQEISELLDIPVGTVKSRLFRARRRLQRRLYAYAVELGYVE